MTNLVNLNGVAISIDTLENDKMEVLISFYNEAARSFNETEVKRFADRKTALARTTKMLLRLPAFEIKPEALAKEKAKKAPSQPRAATPRSNIIQFNLPLLSGQVIKAPREGSRRHIVWRMLLSPGATFEEVHAATWASEVAKGKTDAHARRMTYEGIRLLHFYCGYGLRMDGDRIVLFPS